MRTTAVFPVTHREHGITSVSLRELLVNAHEYTDVACVVPPATVGMLRVLYVIAARVTGLDRASSVEEWSVRRRAILNEGAFRKKHLDEYLEKYADRWDLFHPVWPWLQDPRLVEQAELKPANVLDPTRPGDNSPIWWRHTHRDHSPPIPVAEALQWLLVHHFYGSGGTGGTRQVGNVHSQHMSAGPLRSTLSFHPWCGTLFETLIAGIPSPSTVASPSGEDLAPWELGERHDPLATPPDATWPAGVLTGRSRHAILLVANDTADHVVGCYLTWAWKQKHPPHEDPYTIHSRRNDGTWEPRAADATRALWRDVDALLADHPEHHRPAILTATLSLPDRYHETLRVRAYGFDQDRKATNNAWYTATTPPLVTTMSENDPARATGARLLHTAAEEVATEMRKALRKAYRSLGTGQPGRRDDDVPWLAPADTHYWPAAENLFWDCLRHNSFDDPHRAYVRIAVDAVDVATRHISHQPPVAREVARAVQDLRIFAAKKNPRPPKTKDDDDGE
nr:type I-E CRISPR-associated protein Cse1/CasA [Kibdelosporangium phytohabitans]